MSSELLSADAAPRRVVVTGLGVVSPLGSTAETFWQRLTTPEPAREPAAGGRQSPDNSWPRAGGPADFAGRIEDFAGLPADLRKQLAKSLKVMNRETQLGVAAGVQALADSGVRGVYEPDRFGVCFSAGNVSVSPEDFQAGVQACADPHGELDLSRWGTSGLIEMAPLWLLRCLPNMPACHLAILHDLRGPNNTITQRDVAADLAVAEACRAIQAGVADAMLVGGTGTTLTPINRLHARCDGEIGDEFDGDGPRGLSGGGRDGIGDDGDASSADERLGGDPDVAKLRELARRWRGDDPQAAGATRESAPSEGAAAIVLEDRAAAVRRGARIYGEVLATASASRLHGAHGAVRPPAVVVAVKQALRRAALTPESLGHLHVPGWNGLQRMSSDVWALSAAFRALPGQPGADACLPVVAARARLGHAGVGSGALELVASLLALDRGELFSLTADSVPGGDSGPSADAVLRLVFDRGAPAGSSFLKISQSARGQASCVVVGRHAG